MLIKDSSADTARISFWFRDLEESGQLAMPSMQRLDRNREADVCIVGAGYTGLWLAYELKRAQPQLDIVIVEAKHPGYGASGRNGGAVIPRINGSRVFWAKKAGRDGVKALQDALNESVSEVGAAVERESIDCAYTRSGMIEVARNTLELERFQSAVTDDREWGSTADEIRLLDAAEATARVRAHGVLGAKLTANAASIQPAALALGLARAVASLGVHIYCESPVTAIRPRRVETATANVKANLVVCAAEAYSQSIETERNRIVPVHTSMLVTERLSPDVLEAIGWRSREVLLAEHPFLHLQRTASGRITIGGDDNRLTYKFGSRPCPDGPTEPKVVDMYRAELIRLFPQLKHVCIEQSWQGIFGARRDWAPAVGIDHEAGIAWAGGYVGEGLAASNLAARTLRDLIVGNDSKLSRLPIVRKRPRNWEIEPLRIIGATAILGIRSAGEHRERVTGQSSKLGEWGNRLAGFTGFTG